MAAGSPVPSVKMEELHTIIIYIFAPSSMRNREKRWMNKKEQDEMLQEERLEEEPEVKGQDQE
jgi:hypothetical protein